MEIVRLTEGEKSGAEALRVHASAPTRLEAPATIQSAPIRQAGPDDIELPLDVVGATGEDQAGPPVWSGLRVPGREELCSGRVELLEDETTVVLLAERDGTSLGYVAVHAGGRTGVAQLPVAGARPDVRGSGLGVALVEHALHRAQLDGYETIELDWRSTNLLASRLWPRRGFRPTHLRLRGDVQPTA